MDIKITGGQFIPRGGSRGELLGVTSVGNGGRITGSSGLIETRTTRMPRGPRRGGTAERRIARKNQRTLLQTHGGYAGPSLIETLETELLEATIKYIQTKDREYPEDEEYTLTEWMEVKADRAKKLATARGIMRGLATAVAVWRNVYVQDTKGVEKEFVRLARTEVTNV